MTEQSPPETVFRARIVPGAAGFDPPAQQTLLLAAAAAGPELPSACRNGSCRSCIYRLLEGRLLPCVAYPQSDVVLQFQSSPSLS